MWILLIAGLILLGLILYWQLVIAEGVYLGQTVVTKLYDLTAHKYESIKEFNPQDERDYLALPLCRALGRDYTGVVLDVATGTARLPRALNQIPHFKGNVIGLDHSPKMLAIARQLQPDLALVMADAMRLPFPADSVGGVTCLEALEFLPQPADGLAELVRVLGPGGVLLTTRRIGWETHFMPGKTWTKAQLEAVLADLPLAKTAIQPWQDIYDQVWGRKFVKPLTSEHID